MPNEEQAIRELVSQWLAASKAGDVEAVLGMMTDDVVFMVPGHEPFGKAAFAASSRGMRGTLVEGTSDIVEIQVLGEWAWMRNKLRVVVTPPGGQRVARAGYTLTILRKQEGQWRIARDANLLATEKSPEEDSGGFI